VLAASELPLDENGLPLWVERSYADFPVRVHLEDARALDRLLERVPIASFHREQVRIVYDTPYSYSLEFEPRVTESELRRLEQAGYSPRRLPDRERETWEWCLDRWAQQAERGGEVFARGERGVYHTYAQLGEIMADAAADHPAICELGSIGYSVQGRTLWTLKLSDSVGTEEVEPEVRISANMHGNEKISMEMSIYLIEYLTDNYGLPGYEDVTYLVDNYEIHFLPLHNPDGHVVNQRRNANNVDLNRNFPVPDGSQGEDGTYDEEVETWQFKDWCFDQDFVISQDGHSGALVVNYPWDYTFDLTPDNETFILLSEEYSWYNQPMWNGDWYHGITNGAQWSRTWGSLQDWSYHETGSMHVIVEFSDYYAPPAGQLDQYWDDNRESFMHWIKAARYGVNGVVTDTSTGLPLAATVTVAGNAKPVYTDPDHGDYYKLLEDGSWDISFSAPDYITQTVYGVSTTWGTPTVLNIQLVSDGTASEPAPPRLSELIGAYPNPFNPRTTLRFTLAEAGRARLAIHDIRGRVLRTLVDGDLPAGEREAAWDGRDGAGESLPSGVYFARLELGKEHYSSKLLLLK